MTSTTSPDGGESFNDKLEGDLERGSNRQAAKAEQESNEEEKAQQESEGSDPDVVDWEGPDDPANPKNW
jgi:hypothetical protein